MKKTILLSFFLFISFTLYSQVETQPESNIGHPVVIPSGIIFTDFSRNSLFREASGTIEELVFAPGCGNYFAVSPDGKTVGFKYIFNDGLQSPALLDIATKEITFLHSPSRRAGQVRFSRSGTIIYSVEEDVYIRKGNDTQKFPIGTYANIVDLSYDGNYFAFNDNNDRLYVQEVSSASRKQVSEKGFFFPLWSPVENTLCYSSLDGSLFVFDTKSERSVSLGKGLNPVWSADGSSLIAERREIEKQTLVNSDLFQFSVDGKHVTQLTKTKNIFETEPSISSVGAIVFHAQNSENVLQLQKDGAAATLSVLRSERIAAAKKTSSISSLKKISSPQVYFEMPYTNQVYDTPDWYNGSAACGPTTAIMVIAYYGLLPEWKVWCSYSKPAHWSYYGNYICSKYRFKQLSYTLTADDPNDNPSWGGYGYMWSTGSPFSRMAAYYQYHGLTALRQGTNSDGGGAPSNDFVVNEVTSGYPYSLCNGLTTAGHIIAINGIGSENHTLISNDPYGNKNISYPSRSGKAASYDWPGYNNGNKNLNNIWWGVSVRYTPPAIPDSIVDDLQFTKGFSMSNTGTTSMYSWSDMNAGYNGHFWYVKTKKSDTCYAVWRPTIQRDGMYEVSAYIQYSNAKAAKYVIQHNGGISTVVADQSPIKTNWLTLGTFAFSKDSSAYVRLGDGSDSTGQEIIFDAIRWTYQAPLSVTQKNLSTIPNTMQLKHNYPNPFNPTTTISFSIPAEYSQQEISLRVFNLLGEEIAELVHERLSAGEYSIPFNAQGIASGTYFYQLRAGNSVQTQRMSFVK